MPRFFALVRRGLRSAACSPFVAVAVMAAGLAQPLAAARVSPIHTHALGSADPMAIKVTLAHNGNGTAAVNVGATSSTTFTAQNLGTQTLTVSFVATVCNGALQAGSCSPSPTSRTMNPGDAVTVTVTFHGGASPGNGTLTLAAKNGSTTLATSSVAVTVNPTPGPTVSTSPHRGDALDVSQCVADCFESTFSYTTPAYVSLDVPRSVTLLYRSGRAKPYGRLQLGAIDGNASVTSFRLQLTDSASGTNVVFTNNATSLFFAKKPGDTTRLVAEFDAAAIPTSARLYTASVTSYAGATALGTTMKPVRIIVLNDRTSIYGAGVDMVGLQRMFTNQTGGVLVTDGTGSASFFGGACTPTISCSFTAPAGDFSTLATTGAGYRRTYRDGSVVTFNSRGQETSSADRFGTATQVSYVWSAETGQYVPAAITDPTGQAITFHFRTAAEAGSTYTPGSLSDIVVQGVRNAKFGILAPNGNLDHFLDVDGTWTGVAGYDTQHRITQFTNKQGGTTNFGYAYGRTLKTIDVPAVTINGVPGIQPRTQFRDAYSGLYTAADSGRGATYSTAIPVPTFDIRAAINDPLGYGTYFTLSRFGSPTVVYAPLTNPAYATYDTLTGQLTRSVSPTGAVQRLTWVNDQLRQTIDSSAGAATTVNVEYETSYSLPTRIYGSVAEQLFTYDHTKAGWPLKTSKVGLPSALPTTYAFDTYGRPTSVIDPIGHTTTYAYAATGLRNHTSVTTPNTQSTTFAHDAWGRDTLVKDPKLATWRQGYDILNRVAWTLSPLVGDTTKFQYDSLDNVTKVTDAKGQAYTTLRNALGWVVKEIDPAGRVDSAAYDSAGRVVYTKSRQERVVTLQYDALGRVTQQIGAGGSDVVTFTYDLNHRWVAARSVTAGTLISTDTIFTDSLGRTASEVSYRPGAYSWSVRTGYQSDKPGRVSLNVLKSGAINGGPINTVSWTNFWYDSAQRLSQIRLLQGNSVFTYNDDNQPQAVTFPSGLGEGRSYTSSHALSKRFYTLSAIDTVLGRWYRSDSLARLVRRGGEPGKKLQDFGYDLKGRLWTWQKKTDTGVPSCQNINGYGYDCSSTQLRIDSSVAPLYDNVGNPADPGVVVDTANRLRAFNSYTMTYDADGNMLTRTASGVTDTYTWNDFGQLTTVARNGTTLATFAYDGFGRRIRKTAGGSSTDYVWDGGQLIADGGSSSGATETYSYYPGSDQLHSVTTGGQTYYASIEPTGDVNALLRGSDNAVVAQYGYTPWGEIASSTQQVPGLNSLRWKGLIWDDETKLYYMRARYYDPKLRRFISEDPIGLGGGINMYAFANNDPINLGDPSGTDACRRVFGPEWSQLGPDGWTVQTVATYSYVCDLTSSFSLPDWPGPQDRGPGSPRDTRHGRDGEDSNTCSSHTLETQATIGLGGTLAFGFPLGAVWSGSINVGVASSGRFVFQLQGVFAPGAGIFAGVGMSGGAGIAAYEHTQSHGEASYSAVALAGGGAGPSVGGQLTIPPGVAKSISGPGIGAYAGVGIQGTKQWSTPVMVPLRRLMGNTCHD